ncbi:sugar kinase [Staphylococcus gallinarum]|uniref:sugar kinase n=1 Tax=Staphylococcus gallinarum TaxID=1293 RepID=UPI001E3936C6|nr:sugar kinase [Staphylococcus gallinarum]MCD8829741.1 sugar kinase [Staphylococcus gallinarum]MEB6054146.1 sugar kinase [Staphylococcus gallinarum]
MTIYGLGEVMLRYTPPDYSLLKNAHTFDVQVGGAELNTLISLSSFDHNTEMITVLPKHELAKIPLQKMAQTKIGTRNIKYREGRLGTYYLEESFGFRSSKVIYDRQHSTFAEFEATLFDIEQMQAGDYFVITGITLAVNSILRNNIISLLTQIKARGAHIVFDINYRSNLWDKEVAKATVESILPLVDVLLFGKMDATHLLNLNSEIDSMETCARTIQDHYHIPMLASSNRDIAASTLQGVILQGDTFITGEIYPYQVLNRIGAGDAFMSGIIHGLIEQYPIEDTLDFATKCAVLQHTTKEDALSCQVDEVLNLAQYAGSLKR